MVCNEEVHELFCFDLARFTSKRTYRRPKFSRDVAVIFLQVQVFVLRRVIIRTSLNTGNDANILRETYSCNNVFEGSIAVKFYSIYKDKKT